jgi:predicted ester cyclase
VYHSADALIAELWVTGTHLGRIEGIEPTNKGVRFAMAAFFLFDGDELTCVRNYFDHATIARQLA